VLLAAGGPEARADAPGHDDCVLHNAKRWVKEGWIRK
jgi:hypothetical protein